MSISVAEDIAQILHNAGIGTLDNNIFINFLPDAAPAPDDAFAIFEYYGFPPSKAMASTPGSAILEKAGIQVRVRHRNGETATTWIYSAFKALDGYFGTVNGHTIDYIGATGSPFFLIADEKDRINLVFNCIVSRRIPS